MTDKPFKDMTASEQIAHLTGGAGLFKPLTPEEQAECRKWARDNYKPFEPINGVWHPIVQEECVKINIETGYWPTSKPPGPVPGRGRIVPGGSDQPED